MPKSKKRSGGSGAAKGRSVSNDVSSQVQHLIGVALVGLLLLFLLASVFDKAGALGGVVHSFFQQGLGATTPLVALLIIWLVGYRFLPQYFTVRIPAVLGVILFVVALNGTIHSFVRGDLLTAARLGEGGGFLGYFIAHAIMSTFGLLIGRVVLFVFIFISLIVLLDPLIKDLITLGSKDEEGDEEMQGEDDEEPSRVKVRGEIIANPLSRFKHKLIKPAAETPVSIMEAPKARRLDGVRPMSRTANWSYPPSSLLDVIDMKPQAGNIQKRMETIQKTLRDFNIEVSMSDVNVGPTVTQFTLKPSEGVRLNTITAREADLALALAAQSLRVEAPIPGKALVGIEIPNDKKAMVGLRDVLESKVFKATGSKLALALGLDVAGAPAVADLARMPHALIAGSTGSGKSVAINSIILTLLMNNSPEEMRMILVDPKRVELIGYNGLPHLLTPVITEAKDTVAALNWCVKEMERRYKLFGSLGKRNIAQYNEEPELGEGKMPFIVLIIDEMADLMMVAAKEVEGSIVRLAQMARAVGIHLILATQRPSVDVITGLIKANVPTRIAFAVASQIDSRTILDMSGAEKLLGQGDMLYVSTDTPRPKRIQSVYASEKEITSIVAHIKMQEAGDRYDPSVLETRVESRLGGSRESGEIDDDLFEEAFEVVRQAGKASSTLLQTRLSVGYARAARLMQQMEDKGMIGPAKGSKPREVYGTAATAGLDEEEAAGGIVPYPED